MRRWIRVLSLAVMAAVACGASVARADDAAAVSPERAAMISQIEQAEVHLIDLAQAMPESKYGWRPGKGVRSVREVFMHVVGANYMIPGFYGFAAPAGMDLSKIEEQAAAKAQVVQMLKDSFASAKKSISDASDADLAKPVKMFGMDMTERGAMMIIVTHAHEHLGQSIAYARMNGVVPPWTAKQQAAAAAKKN